MSALAQLKRAAAAYTRASRAYNRDCNMRLGINPEDARRRQLREQSEQAFQKMHALAEAALKK